MGLTLAYVFVEMGSGASTSTGDEGGGHINQDFPLSVGTRPVNHGSLPPALGGTVYGGGVPSPKNNGRNTRNGNSRVGGGGGGGGGVNNKSSSYGSIVTAPAAAASSACSLARS